MHGIKIHSTSTGSSGTVYASRPCDRIKTGRGFIKQDKIFTLEQATKAQRGRRGIALLFF